MNPKLDYDDVARHLSEAMIFADREGVIRAWNPAAEAVFGFPADEVLGQSLDVIIPESMRAAHWKGYEMAMQRGEVLHSSPQQPSRITKALHKSGQPLYVDMSFAVVKDPSGHTTGSFAVAREATERFQQERATRRELTELRAAREAKPI
jgi:PAS domain S-box-containing protein